MRRGDKLEERKGTDWHRDDSQMSGHTRRSRVKECRGEGWRRKTSMEDINNLC